MCLCRKLVIWLGTMEAIILVGGLGSRLGELTKNTPKPMLPIRGIPFLNLLLQDLKSRGFHKVILATGYKKNVIHSYFSNIDDSLPMISYSHEEKPLGTGGGIMKAFSQVLSDHVFVLNGDSYLDVNFSRMHEQHIATCSDITLASYYMDSADRYGVLSSSLDSRVLKFNEKGKSDKGIINGGIYLLRVSCLQKVFARMKREIFSFEEDILSFFTSDLSIFHFQSAGYFIDIGVPEDYARAQKELFLHNENK